MFEALVMAVVFGPPFLLVVLWKTPFRWVPGALLLVGAFIALANIHPTGHGEEAVLDGLANGVMAISAISLGIYGVIMLVVGMLVGRRAEKRAPVHELPVHELPVAIAVAGVNKD